MGNNHVRSGRVAHTDRIICDSWLRDSWNFGHYFYLCITILCLNRQRIANRFRIYYKQRRYDGNNNNNNRISAWCGAHIILVAQDPLRDNTWYSDIDKFPKGKTGCKEDYICIDALVASPFGLHGKSWRDKKNGGGRMALLVEKLIEHGYGVYLTDCRKYFVYDHRESAEYSKEKKNIYKAILQKEIGIVNPQRIVAVGNEAYDYCYELIGDDVRLLHVPHISGLAAKKQKNYFELDENKKTTIEELVERYAKYIISEGK